MQSDNNTDTDRVISKAGMGFGACLKGRMVAMPITSYGQPTTTGLAVPIHSGPIH